MKIPKSPLKSERFKSALESGENGNAILIEKMGSPVFDCLLHKRFEILWGPRCNLKSRRGYTGSSLFTIVAVTFEERDKLSDAKCRFKRHFPLLGSIEFVTTAIPF